MDGVRGYMKSISVRDLSNIKELLSASKQSRAVKAVASLQGSSVKQKTDKITMDEIKAESRWFVKN